MYGGWSGAGGRATSGLAGVRVDMVDETVGHGLLCREPAVTVGVRLDLRKGLAGVLRDELSHLLLDMQHLLSLDLDVRGRTADAAGGLMHHHAGVGRGVALTRSTGAEQELAHAGRQAHRDRCHVVWHPLHGVEDGHTGSDRTTG